MSFIQNEIDFIKKKRPLPVWILSLIYIISSSAAIAFYSVVTFNLIPLPPPVIDYVTQLGLLDHILSVSVILANLFGAIALLFLHKTALFYFSFSLVVNMIITAKLSFEQTTYVGENVPSNAPGYFGLLILGAVVFYVWTLVKRKVLT